MYFISRGLSQVSIYSLFVFTLHILVTAWLSALSIDSGQNSANGEEPALRVQMRLKGENDET